MVWLRHKAYRAFEMKVFATIGNVMISSCNHLLFSLVVRSFGLSQRHLPELAQHCFGDEKVYNKELQRMIKNRFLLLAPKKMR